MYPDYPVPVDEVDRQRDLERFGVLDHESDVHFDRLVRVASYVLETPIALISLVDGQRQWFLARHGLEATETPREMAFCAHAIAAGETLVVPDARNDPRFCSNPLVTGEPGIRFYAGAPLQTDEGHNLGTLCLIDRLPRQFSAGQVQLLEDLAELVLRELNLRRASTLCSVTGVPNQSSFMDQGQRELERAKQSGVPLALMVVEIDHFSRINNIWGHATGDQMLHDLADLCRQHLRPADLIGRLGGVRFAFLLIDTDSDAALERAESMRTAILEWRGLHASSAEPLSISGGLTELDAKDQHLEDLMQRAQQALAVAQSNGHNQVVRLLTGH